MHPLLAHPSRLLLHALVWVAIGLLLGVTLHLVDNRTWLDAFVFALPVSIVYGFVVLSAWWVCRSNPLSGGRGPRSVATQISAAILSSGVWVALATLWAGVLSARFHLGPDRFGIFRDDTILFMLGIPAYMMSAVAHYLFLAFQASHAAERRVLEVQVSAREAELRALRAQLNPHFLFNSLNSINALVGSDPEGARRMCEGLGDFLRRTLNLGARESVTLAEEMALVDRYLAIEQVRFGDRLHVERVIEPSTTACRVPPLLLQPLVENAVKHGVSSRVEGGTVRIEALRSGPRLTLSIENPVDEDGPASKGEGVGLDNVRRRLAVLGGRNAHLEVKRLEGLYRVQLSLMAEEDPAPVPVVEFPAPAAGVTAKVPEGGRS
jgi:hypothetical protein